MYLNLACKNSVGICLGLLSFTQSSFCVDSGDPCGLNSTSYIFIECVLYK